MLLQFTVENFRSFKDKAVFSLEASADKELKENYATIGKNNVLKVASIFGANASGKSNFFLALRAAILLIRTSKYRQPGDPLDLIVPFLFSADSTGKPTSFEFVFLVDNIKYVYGFSATREKVEKEYLYAYKTAKVTTIFERDIAAKKEYRYTVPALKKELTPIEERNTPNKLFLATATVWNCKETEIPFRWFNEKIDIYSTDYNEMLPLVSPMYENDQDGSLKSFMINILQEADFNIGDYIFDVREVSDEHFKQRFPRKLQFLIPTGPGVQHKDYLITTIHHTDNDYTLPMEEESQGTKSLFMLSPLLKKAFETGRIICIDEFDTHLHPMLVIFLVGLFNNPNVNTGNAQLIISVHTTELLSLKVLRRDQIYFIQKDRTTCVSELYSLDEFSPRTREDIRKAYLLGRYGSVPELGDGDSL